MNNSETRLSSSHVPRAVVVGAGPAGLGAAIGLARKGFQTVVLEQHDHLGDGRRGETIRYDELMEDILGKGFFDRITLRKVCRRRYYSHSGLCHVDRTISNPNMIFSWPEMIAFIGETAQRDGVVIQTGMKALNIIFQDGRVAGIEAGDGKSVQMFPADTVLLCGGCHGPASLGIAQNRTGIDMSVHKLLVKGYNGPDDRLEYHFHVDHFGLLIGTMFPRGNGEAELILLDTSDSSDRTLSFDEFCSGHPLFQGLMQGTQTFYELLTHIPMGGMLYPFSPMPGLIMAGDSLGHVQARGGSGVKTSFLIAHAAASLAAEAASGSGWNEKTRDIFEKTMCRNHLVRSLRLHNLFYAGVRSRIFKHIRTPEQMDKAWPLLSLALR